MKKLILLLISMLSLILMKENKLEGNIINIDSNTFTILTSKGFIYKFDKNYDFKYKLDDNVEILYKKNLNNFTNIQNIDIKKLIKFQILNF